MTPGTASERVALAFPEDFLWGTATSAHQIEGGNVGSDWWAFEHDPASGTAEPSSDACDSFHRWPEDLALVAEMGLGAYRFSLEWSRIEPEEGEWSTSALDHYRRMCEGCLSLGLQPVVTFHHFTNPRWFAELGGWEEPSAADRFGRFVEVAARHLGDVVGWGCTLNEPNVVAVLGYMQGRYPPGIEDLDRYLAVNTNLAAAHRRGVEAARSAADFPVGMTLSMDEMQAVEGGEGFLAAAREILEDSFLRATSGDDFIGVQTYTRIRFGPEGELGPEPGVPMTQLGTEVWPQALAHTVRRAAAVSGLPVLVTENGLSTDSDRERIDYLDRALRGLHSCIGEGVDVRGYFVWSLLDNFEWDLGYRPAMGLCSVRPGTFERRRKPSADWYAAVASANALGPPPG